MGISLKDRSELSMAISLGHQVMLKLVSNEVVSGRPFWGLVTTRVKVKTTEGPIWIPLDEIKHVTRMMPFRP
ncbi:hypothetical protein D3C87_1371010 [compost metagenome]